MPGSKSPANTDGASEVDVQQRLVKALAHPIRMRALTILNERVASPSEIALELSESLGVVSYHMRTLEQLGCIELVRRAQRRGAVEHYYRAIVRPWLPDEQILDLPKSIRETLTATTFNFLVDDVVAASKEDGFERPEHCMVRYWLFLDEEGWEELSGLLQAVLDRAVALAGEAQNRATERGEEDGMIPAILGMQLFERRTADHDRQQKAATRKKKPGPDVEFT